MYEAVVRNGPHNTAHPALLIQSADRAYIFQVPPVSASESAEIQTLSDTHSNPGSLQARRVFSLIPRLSSAV